MKQPNKTKDRRYYSHKFDGCTLKWELGIAVHFLQIVHLAGPFHSGKHDSSICKGEEDKCDDKELQLKLGAEEEYMGPECKIPEGKFGIVGGAKAERCLLFLAIQIPKTSRNSSLELAANMNQ